MCYIRIHDTYLACRMEWSSERNLNNNIENSLIVLFWGPSHFIFQQLNIILIRDSVWFISIYSPIEDENKCFFSSLLNASMCVSAPDVTLYSTAAGWAIERQVELC